MFISERIFALTTGAMSIFTPRASRQSAVPHLLEAALFPCFATGTPVDDTTMEASVEILKVFEPSPPVPTISKTSTSFKNLSQCSLITLAADVISSIVSPFMLMAVRKAAFCASVASPSIISFITAVIISSSRSLLAATFAIASLIMFFSSFLIRRSAIPRSDA